MDPISEVELRDKLAEERWSLTILADRHVKAALRSEEKRCIIMDNRSKEGRP